MAACEDFMKQRHCLTRLACHQDEAENLREQLRSHLADHEYIRYYPKSLPYTSLFPAKDSEASKRRRTEIRQMIKKQMASEGVASADVQDEKVAEKPKPPGKKATKEETDAAPKAADSKAKGKKRKAEAELAVEEEEEETPKPSKVVKKGKGKKVKQAEPVKEEVPKKKKKLQKGGEQADGRESEVHPSWSAKKGAKVSGAIVSGAGDRKVFDDSDDD